ncbi:MAG: ABC transporter permease [Candidatus Altiarchaeota archaeon]|nr:ABC transporter permease [Candidatus Altiarchaeota archaeon]
MRGRGIYIIWLRWVKRYLRSKSRIVGSLGMPLFFLLLLGFGLNPSIQMAGVDKGYFGFVSPGIVAMSVLFVSMFAGIQVIWDKQFGFLKETLVAPVSRVEIMIGQTLGGATTSLLQGLLTLLIAFLLGGGLSFTLTGFFIALVFMVLVGISFTALGIAMASKMDDMHGFQLIMNFVIFPIFGLSGALFPIENVPAAIRPLIYLDPMTYGVEGIRYGLLGVSDISPVTSFIFLTSFMLLTIILGQHLFKNIKV